MCNKIIIDLYVTETSFLAGHALRNIRMTCRCTLTFQILHFKVYDILKCKIFFDWFGIRQHTSKINDLRSSLNSKKKLQNFLYLYKKKTQVVFFVFHFEQLSFSLYECPGLCRHRPGHS